MKKKVVFLMLASFIVGGVVSFAATNYYADMVLNQKDMIKDEITEHYTKVYSERGQQQHHDMTAVVWTEVESLKERLKDYATEKVHSDADGRYEEHVRAIQEAIEQVEAEMIEYIDSLGDSPAGK